MLGLKRLGLLALCGLFALVHISSRGGPVGLEEVVFQVPDARMLAATQKKMDEGQIQVRQALNRGAVVRAEGVRRGVSCTHARGMTVRQHRLEDMCDTHAALCTRPHR